ncbi:MAG TPA: aminotransferase class I/II-fold pyridoxal phosphate-dependent enzyme [Candidatus Marinimicrobia bacterium]|jgi:aspartate/methionine/tyrosine aminotransferase|nr:aminotransferase class I/II-fold pyridoxal phosphate-dependent enzyme [Candidatus Neomarinimicrobiota bacterium]MDP7217028.1 aminotransferase class I/II-fold pyridoxal phosphate-dependent enzyme [Candidatus Neomarinimicrobiota bacterium]MDP7436442.1 aminotransferase class I/II-fold pyridoxal phosphate-dependent enzyme [Candidatus Neomarinimicrobiota bacterium]MDP7654204.1 aminotransferase class I/II-fold pyridoxal phosphate-dependent enzyme [Candidatus Neomarinimicrobiota bacterium]HBN45200.|tara:strand:+ start:12390 stop:13589 length:1200 start_codon:yes stop_codon:yes gene_type:complete
MRIATRISRLGTETAFAVSAQAREWVAKGNKVYPFHLGDINLSTPQNIIEAANRYIVDGKNGYCPSEGILSLREALAHDVGSKRGVSYGPENISVQPGGKPTIGKFIQAIMNPGDEVLYPNPGYPIYESQIEYHGGSAVPYRYDETDKGFEIDIEKLRSSVTDKTVALIYNNYNNPISAESSREEMETLAQLAIENDLWVLSDDAYYEMLYDTDPLSIVNIPGMQERTVILYTFSKKFAMTGWRIGASIGPENVIKVINKLNVNDESCTNHFHQWAMVEAINGDQSGSKAILDELRKRRDVSLEGLNAIEGIDIATPECTFYLFPNVTRIMERKRLTSVADLQVGALHNSGVSFCTRDHFGRPQEGETDFYIRFAYSGITVEDIKEGMVKLKDYFESSD